MKDKLRKLAHIVTEALADPESLTAETLVVAIEPSANSEAIAYAIGEAPEGTPLTVAKLDKQVEGKDSDQRAETAMHIGKTQAGLAHAIVWFDINEGKNLFSPRITFANRPHAKSPEADPLKIFETAEPVTLYFRETGPEDIAKFAFFVIGLAFYKTGNSASALQAFGKLDGPEARFFEGLCLIKTGQAKKNMDGQLERAFACFNQTLEYEGDDIGDLGLYAFANVASVYLARAKLSAEGEMLADLEQAINASRGLINTIEDDPAQFAAARASLGEALLSKGLLIKPEDSLPILREAAEEFAKACEHVSLNSEPERWAALKARLADTSRELGARLEGDEAMDPLKLAVKKYGKAAAVLDRNNHPFTWARLMSFSAAAHVEIGERTKGKELLENFLSAINAHRHALEIWNQHENPVDWAAEHNNLGNAQFGLASALRGGKGAELAGEAMESYDKALEVFDETHFQLYHQGAQMNKAKAMLLKAGLEGKSSGPLPEDEVSDHMPGEGPS